MSQSNGEGVLRGVLSTVYEALAPTDGSPGLNEDEEAAFWFTLHLFAKANLELKWPTWQEDTGWTDEDEK